MFLNPQFCPSVRTVVSEATSLHRCGRTGFFGPMSIKIMNEVWETSEHTGGNLLVLLALADFADADAECWPSVSTLARKSRLTDRHVRRILLELEESGELQRVLNGGRNGSNKYRLTPKTLTKSQPLTPESLPPLTLASETPDAHVSQTVINRHTKPSVSDEDWLKGLEQSSAYSGVNVVVEFEKMKHWCLANNCQPTRRRFVNWLNRCRPLRVSAAANGSRYSNAF